MGEGVLIPRPETELIVDRVIGHLISATDKEKAKSVIELGAGSGAISIAIASEATLKGLKVSMVAVEKSPEAAAWLNKNIAKYDLPIRVVVEDVATALPDVKADVVVANPPYIPNDERLPIEVAKFEPEMALRGGPVDGMQIPKLFIDAATRLLKPGGFFITEHHEKQGELIRSALAKDYLPAQTHADLIPPRISEIKVIIAMVKYQGELARMLSSGFSTPTVTALLRPAVSSSRFSVTQVTAVSDAFATCELMSICFGKNAAQAN